MHIKHIASTQFSFSRGWSGFPEDVRVHIRMAYQQISYADGDCCKAIYYAGNSMTSIRCASMRPCKNFDRARFDTVFYWQPHRASCPIVASWPWGVSKRLDNGWCRALRRDLLFWLAVVEVVAREVGRKSPIAWHSNFISSILQTWSILHTFIHLPTCMRSPICNTQLISVAQYSHLKALAFTIYDDRRGPGMSIGLCVSVLYGLAKMHKRTFDFDKGIYQAASPCHTTITTIEVPSNLKTELETSRSWRIDAYRERLAH